jgi:hypothetical protein
VRGAGFHLQQPCSPSAWSQPGTWRSLRKGRHSSRRRSARVKVCFAFQRTGTCNFGTACVFSHDACAVALAAPLGPATAPTCPCRACHALDHDLATCPLLSDFKVVQDAMVSVAGLQRFLEGTDLVSEEVELLAKDLATLVSAWAVRFELQGQRRRLLLRALGEATELLAVSDRVDPS